MERQNEVLDNVIIKFAGDSGDGMQLTGTQFTNTAALFGNDLSTFRFLRCACCYECSSIESKS